MFNELCDILDRAQTPGLTQAQQKQILREGAMKLSTPETEIAQWYMTRAAGILGTGL